MKNEFYINIIHKRGNSFIAEGKVYNDEKERFEDGCTIYTSKIRNIDFINKKLFTKNTEYNLMDTYPNVILKASKSARGISTLKVGERVYRVSDGEQGKICNINNFREPSMKYAVDFDYCTDDVIFIGENEIERVGEDI